MNERAEGEQCCCCESTFEFIVPHSNISSTHIPTPPTPPNQTKPLHIEFTHPCIHVLRPIQQFSSNKVVGKCVLKPMNKRNSYCHLHTQSLCVCLCALTLFFIHSIYQLERPKPYRTAGMKRKKKKTTTTVERQTTKI